MKTTSKNAEDANAQAVKQQSDDEQDETNEFDSNDVNAENSDNEETNDKSSKIDDINNTLNNKPLNDVYMQDDNNNFKLEATQSLSRRSPIMMQNNEDTIDSNSSIMSCSLQSCLHRFTSPELLTGNNKFGCENCTRIFHRKNTTSTSNTMSKEMKTVYTQATKQYLICELPAVLTIHLKRFRQHGFRLEKESKHVNFPLELDMSPYTSKMCTNLTSSNISSSRVLYSLYGIVEHSGGLNGGHYTAYVKVRNKQCLDKALGKKRLIKLIKQLNNTSLSLSNNNISTTSTENISLIGANAIGGAIAAVSSSTSSLDNNVESSTSNNGNYTWYHISDSHVKEVPEMKIFKVQAYILFYERLISN